MKLKPTKHELILLAIAVAFCLFVGYVHYQAFGFHIGWLLP